MREVSSSDGGSGMARRASARVWPLAVTMLALAWWPYAAIAAAALSFAAYTEWWPLAAPLMFLATGVTVAATRPTALPGHAVRPDDEPELAALVDTVARHLGFEGPLLVRITPDPCAALARIRVGGVRTCVLVLGLPLLRTLTEAQLAAVVAHELAHERHTRRPGAAVLHFARDTLGACLDSPFRRRLIPFAPRLLRASQPSAWQAETAADADAARVAGTTATADALRHTHTLAALFHGPATDWWCALEQTGRRPEDFYDALDIALKNPYVARRAADRVAQDDAFDPYATDDHPPLASRVAALPPADGAAAVFRAVPVSLRTAADVEDWCVERLGSDMGVTLDGLWEEHRAHLTGDVPACVPVRLLDMDPDELRRQVDDLVEDPDLRTATGRAAPAEALAAALEALDDGSWPSLADRCDGRIRTAPPLARPELRRDTFRAAVVCGLEGVLRGAGWTSTVRWLGTVLTAPDGRVVDLDALVTGALAGADTTALRALLADARTQEPA
ncbi:M48 family metallopeptidase [Streptomyces sp. NPDC004539]|uniref:M48 family metallopeptidase n=1 Tax=Streptomyces sp. NPDC004539 TaxID=3154280 RepID=UPI00339DDD07